MVEIAVARGGLVAVLRAIPTARLWLPYGARGDAAFDALRAAASDAGVAIEISDSHKALEPSPESRTDSEGFQLLSRTIREVYPDVVVAPNLVLGGTDARYFHAVSESVYRFGPLRLTAEDLKRPHGTNERVRADDYLESVRFYVRLLQNAG